MPKKTCIYVVKFDIFFQTMCKDETTLTEMMHEGLNCYVTLQGVHHVKAEIMYIKEIQMMDGYGMDYYAAKVFSRLHV